MYIAVLLDFILFVKYDTKSNFNSSNASSNPYAAGVMQITVSDVSKKGAYTKHTTIEIRDEKI